MGNWAVDVAQSMGFVPTGTSYVASGAAVLVATGTGQVLAVAQVRRRTYRARLDRHKSLTLSGPIRLHERATQDELDDLDAEPRPVYRSDCEGGERPCPWVSCRHHLYIEVTETGSVRYRFGELELDQIPQTCALDVSDMGGATLEEVGGFLNFTKERVRQIEIPALAKVKLAGVSPSMLNPKMADWLEDL